MQRIKRNTLDGFVERLDVRGIKLKLYRSNNAWQIERQDGTATFAQGLTANEAYWFLDGMLTSGRLLGGPTITVPKSDVLEFMVSILSELKGIDECDMNTAEKHIIKKTKNFLDKIEGK